MRSGAGPIDREDELAEIAGLVERARAGDGGVLLFQGPAGIGKTTLLEAGASAASGVRVLRGHGGEVEHDLSFGLVRELFDHVLQTAAAADRERWLTGPARATASVLGETDGEPQDAASAAYGVYWLLAAMAAEQPVVLVADDLHWCDPSSLRWLVYLARRIEGMPIGLLAASRPVEHGDVGLLAQLAALDHVRVRRPAPLSVDATSALLARGSRLAPAAAFAKACHTATGGNPFLLRELIETMREEGLAPSEASVGQVDALAGDRLRQAVLGRIGRLDPSAARLARAVAVLGDGCELRHASALAGVERDEAVASLPSLIAVGVLADRQPLAFEHPLLRSVVYGDIPVPVRSAEHGRAAALLASAAESPEAIAHQLLGAEPLGEEWACNVLAEAARTAIARGAPESAVAYLRRALVERPATPLRASLLRSLGDALVRLGEPTAVDVLREAFELTESPDARARIVESAVDPLLATGRTEEARALLLRARADVQSSDPAMWLFLSARLATVHAWDGAGAEADLAELRTRESTLDASTPEQRYAAGALALLHAVGDGTAASAVRLARIALDSAGAEIDAAMGRPLHLARVALALAGEPSAALRGVDRALEASRARGSLMGQGIGLGWRAYVHSLAGNVADAENDGRAALAALSDTCLRGPLGGAIAATAWALIERGELAEAQAVLDEAPLATGYASAPLVGVRVQLLLARHRHAAALDELAEMHELAERSGWQVAGTATWSWLRASAQLAAGNLARAREAVDADLEDAVRFGAPPRIGRALRLRGLIEGGDAGLATLEAAVECLRDADARLELARALVDLGAARRRDGDRVRAREPLLEGLELAATSGATALVEIARTELRAAGARPRSVVRVGVEALTPSERRVASLAAEGLANVEIAQALFVTVRTVEMHLSAAYRKLEIASRSELPAL